MMFLWSVFYRSVRRHGMATCYRSFASGSGEFGQVFRGFYKDQEVHDHVGACSTRKTSLHAGRRPYSMLSKHAFNGAPV